MKAKNAHEMAKIIEATMQKLAALLPADHEFIFSAGIIDSFNSENGEILIVTGDTTKDLAHIFSFVKATINELTND